MTQNDNLMPIQDNLIEEVHVHVITTWGMKWWSCIKMYLEQATAYMYSLYFDIYLA